MEKLSAQTLPNEVLRLIFSNLDAVEDKISLSKSCKKFHELIDAFSGLPMIILKKDLHLISKHGISKCTISDAAGYRDSAEYTPEMVACWKYPWLLQHLIIRTDLSFAQQEAILFSQKLNSLKKLELNWIATAYLNNSTIFLFNQNLGKLLELRIYDDEALVQKSEYGLVVVVYENILGILQHLRNLKSISLKVPEPRAHKVFTKACLDFLSNSHNIRNFSVKFDANFQVSAPHWSDASENITRTVLNSYAVEIGTKMKLESFKFAYIGKRLAKEKEWITLIISLRGLSSISVKISKNHNISATIPTAIVSNNAQTIKTFEFSGGPNVQSTREDQDVIFNFGIFNNCKELEQINLDLSDGIKNFQVSNVLPNSNTSRLHHVRISNVCLHFTDIYSLISLMTLKQSTLSFEDVWVQKETENSEDLTFTQTYQRIEEAIGRSGMITCFYLRRNSHFPLFTMGSTTLHIHNFQVLAGPFLDLDENEKCNFQFPCFHFPMSMFHDFW